jgi:hypothetical protein
MFSFPWESGEKPHFVNEEGYEWYLDKDVTKKSKDLGLYCFYVKKDDDITRALIDDKQHLYYDSKTLEGIYCWLDIFKLHESLKP